MFQNILVAIEGKPTDEAALAQATSLALQNAARVTLLQVIAIAADDSGMRHLQMEPGANGWKRKNQAEERVTALERQLCAHNLSVQKAIVVGDRTEADEIVDFADGGKFDLIVMAADGRPAWQRALFGCIADGVHRKATVPTLFVSDGTRRAKVAQRYQPVSINPILDAFSHVECC